MTAISLFITEIRKRFKKKENRAENRALKFKNVENSFEHDGRHILEFYINGKLTILKQNFGKRRTNFTGA